MNIQEMFEKYNEELVDFSLVKTKLSNRRDLHAFLLIDKLIPNNYRIIGAAEHDQIWLEPSLELLEKVLTEEHVLELIHCGVFYDKESESLYMYA